MNNYMKNAIKQAEMALKIGEIPVGCVIVRNNKIVSSNHNKNNVDKVAIYHAEILCIIETCKKLNIKYLDECDMFVTLKPCDMCLSAIAEARIKEVYYLIDSNYEVNLNKNKDNIKFYKSNYRNKPYIDMLSLFFKDKSKESSY